MRIKNESRHIQEVLERLLALCSVVFVFDDRSTDNTIGICRAFGSRVRVFPSPFKDLNEARDKNYLLERLKEAQADWVAWIDGDEVLERKGPKLIRRSVSRHPETATFSLQISYLWDRADQVRVDGFWGRFMRPCVFRLSQQRLDRIRFAVRGTGPNFHCGNVPEGLSGTNKLLPVRLKHYGYLNRDDRERKFQWYNACDPNNAAEDCYRHIIGTPDSRFAPGPPRFGRWSE